MSATLRERNRRLAYRAIRDEAMRLFAERGYHAVTVELVAREARVSASTVYRYFGTKEMLAIGADIMDAGVLERLSSITTKDHGQYLDTLCDVLVGGGEGSIVWRPQMLGYVRDIPEVRRTYFAHLRDVAAIVARSNSDTDDPSVEALVRAQSYVFGVSSALEAWYEAGADESLIRDYLAKALTFLSDLQDDAVPAQGA